MNEGKWGVETSFYIQKDLEAYITRILADDPQKEVFKSRSHFINIAIMQLVRSIDEKKRGKVLK